MSAKSDILRRFFFLPILFAISLMGASIYLLQLKLAQNVGASMQEEEILYVTPGRYLKPLVLGYDVAVADLLWLRAVQYVGGESPSEGTYRWLYPMADTITTLDPTFDVVYHSAGIILSVYAKPKRLEESVAIMTKGVESSTAEWRHPFYLSFIYWHYLNDYKSAAQYMALAAAKKGHPEYTERLAARLYAEARDPDSGILFLSHVINSTRDDKVRKELEQRLVDLTAERDIVRLEEAAAAYHQRTGRRPAALSELLALGIIWQVPQEPGGGYYHVDTGGNVKSNRMKERLGVYGKKDK